MALPIRRYVNIGSTRISGVEINARSFEALLVIPASSNVAPARITSAAQYANYASPVTNATKWITNYFNYINGQARTPTGLTVMHVASVDGGASALTQALLSGSFGSVNYLSTNSAYLTDLQKFLPLVKAIADAPITLAAQTTQTITPAYNNHLVTYSSAAASGPTNIIVDNNWFPAAMIAATDYSRRGASSNYMFKQANTGLLTESIVTTEAMADRLDTAGINYYGQVQTAGQDLAFYQRGVMVDSSGALTDINVVVNEMWLKSACEAAIMGMLLNNAKVPANQSGITMLYNVLQPVRLQAVENGTISVGRRLTPAAESEIISLTGDETAVIQVNNTGNYLNVALNTQAGQGGVEEFYLDYLLIYTYDGSVKFVSGSHIIA